MVDPIPGTEAIPEFTGEHGDGSVADEAVEVMRAALEGADERPREWEYRDVLIPLDIKGWNARARNRAHESILEALYMYGQEGWCLDERADLRSLIQRKRVTVDVGRLHTITHLHSAALRLKRPA